MQPACARRRLRLATASGPTHPHPHAQVSHALWLLREALAAGYELPTVCYNNVLQVGGWGWGWGWGCS